MCTSTMLVIIIVCWTGSGHERRGFVMVPRG